MGWATRIEPAFDLERHRALLIAALHSHAGALDDELFTAMSLVDYTARSAAKTRIARERADALDLARDLESA